MAQSKIRSYFVIRNFPFRLFVPLNLSWFYTADGGQQSPKHTVHCTLNNHQRCQGLYIHLFSNQNTLSNGTYNPMFIYEIYNLLRCYAKLWTMLGNTVVMTAPIIPFCVDSIVTCHLSLLLPGRQNHNVTTYSLLHGHPVSASEHLLSCFRKMNAVHRHLMLYKP